MDIIISGLGAVGSTIMEELSKEGHNIVVIDKNGLKVEDAVNEFDRSEERRVGKECRL